MDHFARKNGVLHAENVALNRVAEAVGTPTYVYSSATLRRHVSVLQQALKHVDHLICYAIKANANLSVLKFLGRLGCEFDAVSGGELERIHQSGADPANSILSGVGKRDDEIAVALNYRVRYICVESASELAAVARVAEGLGVVAPIGLRVNPDVDAKTHPYIATGLKKNKFGVPYDTCLDLSAEARRHPHLDLLGVSCHIGSQVTTIGPFVDAAVKMRELAERLANDGPLKYLGIGGGLGVPYQDEAPPSPAEYGAAVASILGDFGATIVLEPGRVIVANAGILLSRVVRIKDSADGEDTFVILDAGMNDLLRPALYGATHTLETVAPASAELVPQTIVGPICESADTFLRQQQLPRLAEGDLIALRGAGAYSFVMASTYNGRPLPAEVMVEGDKAVVVGKRQAVQDLWQGELHPHTVI